MENILLQILKLKHNKKLYKNIINVWCLVLPSICGVILKKLKKAAVLMQ